MDLIAIGVALVYALVALVVFGLCRAARLGDWMLERALAPERAEHYRRCDAFARWDEPAWDDVWPEERAA